MDTFRVFVDNKQREAYLRTDVSFLEFIICEHLFFSNTKFILEVLFVRHIKQT